MKGQLLTNLFAQLKGKKIPAKALSLLLIASSSMFANEAIFAQKQSAQAVQAQNLTRINFKEGQNNNGIGDLKGNALYTINGALAGGSGNTSDTYSFSVKVAGNYTFTSSSNATKLINDKLSILKVGRGVRLIGSTGVGKVLSLRLEPGSYRLKLQGETSPRSHIGYTASIITPKVKSRTVTLNVFKAEALSKFDTGSHPDFYVQSRLDGVAKPNSSTKGNNNKPTFNYQSSQTMSADKSFMIVKVNLRDSDPGKDERADINPSNKANGIEMKYFPATGDIYNNADNKFLGRAGSTLTLQGDSKKHRAKITLKVSHKDNT
ncbi:MAG: C2 domain-containing protein [Cyanobacteria bacterium P01_A01_bin.84]